MSELKYINNRDIGEGSNFLTNLRPSASARILRFPLEYCLFQTALTYGIIYNGFGIHSYYLQKTGASMNYGPWARMKTIGSTFGKYFAVALPFFYLKEVFFSLSYVSTREKPVLRKSVDFAYLQNLFAMAVTFPLFYCFERSLTKSLRGCIVIGVFSMLNDLFIERRRQKLILRGYDLQELEKKRIDRNVDFMKGWLDKKVKDPKVKRQIEQINWTRLRDQAIDNQQATMDVEKLRKEQVESVANTLRQQFQALHKWLG